MNTEAEGMAHTPVDEIYCPKCKLPSISATEVYYPPGVRDMNEARCTVCDWTGVLADAIEASEHTPGVLTDDNATVIGRLPNVPEIVQAAPESTIEPSVDGNTATENGSLLKPSGAVPEDPAWIAMRDATLAINAKEREDAELRLAVELSMRNLFAERRKGVELENAEAKKAREAQDEVIKEHIDALEAMWRNEPDPKRYPLLDKPNPPSPSLSGVRNYGVEKDTFTALLTVGHTEEQARGMIERLLAPADHVYTSVTEMIDAIYLMNSKAEIDATFAKPESISPLPADDYAEFVRRKRRTTSVEEMGLTRKVSDILIAGGYPTMFHLAKLIEDSGDLKSISGPVGDGVGSITAQREAKIVEAMTAIASKWQAEWNQMREPTPVETQQPEPEAKPKRTRKPKAEPTLEGLG
jgi:hypothetical protein